MHEDHSSYYGFTTKSRLDKAVNSLLGIVEGIAIDSQISGQELSFLQGWLREHGESRRFHPFSELIPPIENALSDGTLDEEEQRDIIWLCERLRSTDYYSRSTADLQRLHGIIGAIAGDGLVSEAELAGLAEWLRNHDHLRTCYPYDELDSLITKVMADKKIDEQEHSLLLSFFNDFISVQGNRTIVEPPIYDGVALKGLCAVCPEIRFNGTKFCFTGASGKYSRSECGEIVRQLGGRVVNSVSRSLDYLVIGADGNPCWAYACYGRKVEVAVQLRKEGCHVLLVHEYDFHDAIQDLGI